MWKKLAEIDEESKDQAWISHRAPTNQILQDFEMKNIHESLASEVAFGQITARKQPPEERWKPNKQTNSKFHVNCMFLDPVNKRFKPEPNFDFPCFSVNFSFSSLANILYIGRDWMKSDDKGWL